jgi:hypothetical protein
MQNWDMNRDKPLRRGAPLRPKSPVKRRNHARQAKNADKKWGPPGYKQAVQRMPCAVCGRSPSDPHHVPTWGSGGSWRDLVPLCRAHHTEWHATGEETFDKRHTTDLRGLASTVYNTLNRLTDGSAG